MNTEFGEEPIHCRPHEHFSENWRSSPLGPSGAHGTGRSKPLGLAVAFMIGRRSPLEALGPSNCLLETAWSPRGCSKRPFGSDGSGPTKPALSRAAVSSPPAKPNGLGQTNRTTKKVFSSLLKPDGLGGLEFQGSVAFSRNCPNRLEASSFGRLMVSRTSSVVH